MELLKVSFDVVGALSNLVTIGTASVAVFFFLRNRDKLSLALRMLLTFSFSLTLSELKSKLERLNEYHADNPEELSEVRNILHEIAGQIRGNSKLLASAPDMPKRIESLANGQRLSEPAKRSIVSELREVLRNIQVASMND